MAVLTNIDRLTLIGTELAKERAAKTTRASRRGAPLRENVAH